MIITDQSTIEKKIAILSHRISTLSTRFENNLNYICANSCSVTTGHSQLCKSMSAQHASANTSSLDNRGRVAAPTMMLRTNAQLHQSETSILRFQLHRTFPLPVVLKCCECGGYGVFTKRAWIHSNCVSAINWHMLSRSGYCNSYQSSYVWQMLFAGLLPQLIVHQKISKMLVLYMYRLHHFQLQLNHTLSRHSNFTATKYPIRSCHTSSVEYC